MKYLKLFEQFEEESWWDKESPFDDDNGIKVEDVVVCVNNEHCENDLVLGSNYIVKHIYFHKSGTQMLSVEKEDSLSFDEYDSSVSLEDEYYRSDRFKKIK